MEITRKVKNNPKRFLGLTSFNIIECPQMWVWPGGPSPTTSVSHLPHASPGRPSRSIAKRARGGGGQEREGGEGSALAGGKGPPVALGVGGGHIRVGARNRCHLSNWRFNPETVHFLSSKRPFLSTMFFPNATKQSILAKTHFFTRSQSFEEKVTILQCSNGGKSEITMKTTIWATVIENVVRKGRK